jgi:hypothetical protein
VALTEVVASEPLRKEDWRRAAARQPVSI